MTKSKKAVPEAEAVTIPNVEGVTFDTFRYEKAEAVLKRQDQQQIKAVWKDIEKTEEEYNGDMVINISEKQPDGSILRYPKNLQHEDRPSYANPAEAACIKRISETKPEAVLLAQKRFNAVVRRNVQQHEKGG